jgi:hypothetical protein
MIRTQIYLTETERTALVALSSMTGKPQSELIREAVDNLIEQSGKGHREAVLDQAAGLWKDRPNLPDFQDVRATWDRKGRT